MKKVLLSALVLVACGANATENRIPGAEYLFPLGIDGYDAGTKVQHKDRLFECREFPYSGFCRQYSTHATQYEPGVGFAWQHAWIEITPAPAEGGFGYDYVFPESLGEYGPGTTVKGQDGEVYRCKPFPQSGFCGQYQEGSDQYAPGVGFAWREAWDHVGPAID